MTTVSWIHISDLHAGRPHTWDWEEVRRACIDDVKRQAEARGVAPHFLFFTGDAAWGADSNASPRSMSEQLSQAGEFLHAVRKAVSPEISPDRVFLVPGNHDVDRSLIPPLIQEGLGGLSYEGMRKLFGADNRDWTVISERLEAYREFLRSSGFAHLSSADLGTYTHFVWVDDCQVAITGWNSAWSCGRQEEHGRLWLGLEEHVKQLPSNFVEANLKILLMHHPPGWFRSEEAELAKRNIEAKFDAFLHGHEHDPWITPLQSGFVKVAAGAVYDAEAVENGYNIVAIDTEDQSGSVWFRRYSRRNPRSGFLPDLTVDGVDETGRVSLELVRITPSGIAPDFSSDAPAAAIRNATESPAEFSTLSHIERSDFPLVGRLNELATARELLNKSGILLIHGAPGQGKSALARAIARDYAAAESLEPWLIDVQNEKRVEPVVRQIASVCGQSMGARPSQAIDGANSIIVLDGFEQLHDELQKQHDGLKLFLEELIQGARGVTRFIITSRTSFAKAGMGALGSLEGLEPAAAVELFRIAAKVQMDAPAEDIEEFVVGKLEGHPLSINIVGSYCAALSLDLDELTSFYYKKWETIAEHQPTLDDRTLHASFGLSFDALPDELKAVFLVCGQLPDGISREHLPKLWPDEAMQVRIALGTLRDRSLVQVDGHKRFRILQPLLPYAKQAYEAATVDQNNVVGAQARRLVEAIDRYYDQFVVEFAPAPGDVAIANKNRLIREHFLNIHASFDRRMSTADKPEPLAAAQSILGLHWVYHNNLTGRNSTVPIEDSVQYLIRAQRVFEVHELPEEALDCKFNVGQILWLRGELGVARQYLQEVLDSPGLSSEKRLHCMRATAHMEYSAGNIRRSTELYQEVASRADSEGLTEVAVRTRVGLIDAYRKLEDFGAIDGLMTILDPMLETQVPAVRGNVLRGLAYARLVQSRIEEAERLYRLALAEMSDVSEFGQAHCWRGLGDVFTQQERFADAREAFDLASRLYIQANKPRCLGVGLVAVGRAVLAWCDGDSETGIQLLNEGVALFDKTELNERFEQARCYEHLGNIYSGKALNADAVGAYRLAIVGYRHTGCEAAERRVAQKLASLN